MNIKLLLAAGLLSLGVAHAQDFAKGIVYEDTNKNGKKDKSEIGLKNVSISNGVDVVLTNDRGEYQLPVGNDNIIFVIKPTGYSFSLNDKNLPQFYYVHKPNGSPKLKYTTIDSTGKLPKSLNFPLYPQQEDTKFKALIFGDPQAYNLDEIAYFRKGIVDDISEDSAIKFGISLGDLVGDHLVLHAPYQDAIKEIGKPWYNVMGNHDMNFDVKADSLSDETFEYHFGPNNYAFHYGNAYFIVLDNILYPNPKTGKGYLGGFRNDQLDFVENSLKHVSKDKLIVLSFHIPLGNKDSEAFRHHDRHRLFDILAPFKHTVSMSAHTHFQKQIFYGKADGWKQENPHHEYNVGTTSGDWYSGMYNLKGVPSSTMRDGTPKGYAILNIDNNSYSFDYKVAGEAKEYQMNIVAPRVVNEKQVKRYKVAVNFFMGKSSDTVQYRFGNAEWKNMNYIEQPDPAYQYELLKYDTAEKLIEGRRPSNAVNSTHLWEAKFPNKLAVGNHNLEIRAVDMYGKTHTQKVTIEVVK
ncbi:calcineurin-like phosphoesterase C-terminal domain-containing protein [Sphingobacterium bovistauri]|uniref:Calcineurin-like phosphoesterase C-terminal domain-containing protein n=1 Tax=Sphingobacterium bovistauri TaxID=2781959 RepID=A0ABS7Z2R8_9SPHI|nr:calcineurin-like phosphoesterase C-terminal domain-containing protein [Sphingobacterium bovistauri]MCA5003746.1 calcineurin-like phosphoesterase C-terminal domain-containing protein [Sphingobacterium bovistauri]